MCGIVGIFNVREQSDALRWKALEMSRRTRRLLRIVFSAGILVGVVVALLVILHPFNLPDISLVN